MTLKARLLVRIAIAYQAHFELGEGIDRARAAGAQWSEIGGVGSILVIDGRPGSGT